MTWFKVDDKLHSHSKTRKVLAEAPAALALWVVAGSWSSDNLTDGFVPDHQLPWLIPVGAEDMARQLVSARFWRRVRGGYLFHEWSEDGDGTKRNPMRADVEAERRKKAEAGRKGGLARGKAASTRGNRTSRSQAGAKAGASEVLDPPTRPVPTELPNGSSKTLDDSVAHEAGQMALIPDNRPPQRQIKANAVVAAFHDGAKSKGRTVTQDSTKKVSGTAKRMLEQNPEIPDSVFLEAAFRMGVKGYDNLGTEIMRGNDTQGRAGEDLARRGASAPAQRSTSSQRAADILAIGAQLQQESLNGGNV